jgi:hypothetical protein
MPVHFGEQAMTHNRTLERKTMKPAYRPATPALSLVILSILCAPVARAAAPAEIKLAVDVPAPEGQAVPVCAAIDLPGDLAKLPPDRILAVVTDASGKSVPGQVVRDGDKAQLWWVLPEAAAGKSVWTARLSEGGYAGKDTFSFRDTPGKYMDLLFDGRPVTRYMYEFDKSTPAKAQETYKVFTHVFDETGKDFITKGAGGHDTHHRGIFIGWTNLTIAGAHYDQWSMKNGSQVHRKFLELSAGPVLGRATSRIDWVDKEGKVLITEQRTTTCFRQPAPGLMLMEFATKLTAGDKDVTLDGNIEHAGFQYRAHDDVAVAAGAAGGSQTANKAPDELKTAYEFPADGIKTGGQKLDNNKDLPWAAMCYALRGKRYHVEHMNNPANPKNTAYSAYRPYGRFGAFFVTKIQAGQTLPLVYRIYAAVGTMPGREQLSQRSAAFTGMPKVTVVR